MIGMGSGAGSEAEGDLLSGFEILIGGAGNDLLIGGGGNETITGNRGDDTISGVTLGAAGVQTIAAGGDAKGDLISVRRELCGVRRRVRRDDDHDRHIGERDSHRRYWQ